MGLAQILVIGALVLESIGKVLYGTLLTGVGVPVFLFLGCGLTAAFFLARAGLHLPRSGYRQLLALNLSTAIAFAGFFFALKYTSPAVVASLDLGASLVAAVVMVWVFERTALSPARLFACGGIFAGCVLLSAVELSRSTSLAEPTIWLAFLGAAATGAASTFSAQSSRLLAGQEWKPCQILAHRFYLTLGGAAVWFYAEGVAWPDVAALPYIGLVATLGVIVPLFMLQLALRSADTLTVTVCFAAQPLTSFLIAIPSPAYVTDVGTFAGVMMVTVFLAADIVAQRRLTAPSPVPTQRPARVAAVA